MSLQDGAIVKNSREINAHECLNMWLSVEI